MNRPDTISLSLISHTNVGKTTLARTLLRRDIGEVRDEAHVTQQAERELMIEIAGAATGSNCGTRRDSATASGWRSGSPPRDSRSDGFWPRSGTASATAPSGSTSVRCAMCSSSRMSCSISSMPRSTRTMPAMSIRNCRS